MKCIRQAVEYVIATMVIIVVSPFLAVLGHTISYRGELVVDPDDLDIPRPPQ